MAASTVAHNVTRPVVASQLLLSRSCCISSAYCPAAPCSRVLKQHTGTCSVAVISTRNLVSVADTVSSGNTASLVTRRHWQCPAARSAARHYSAPPCVTTAALQGLLAQVQRLQQEQRSNGGGALSPEQRSRLASACHMLCAAIGSLLGTIPYLLQQCSRYDAYPGVASNGLRSSVSILSTCTSALDDIIKSLLTSSNTKRAFAQAVLALEAHSELLRDHAQLFKVIYAVVQVDKTGNLIVDHTQFPDDFLDTAESMERKSFYGRCLGLHYDKEVRQVLQLIVALQAATGKAYFSRPPTRAGLGLLPLLLEPYTAVRIAADPRQRAADFLDITSKCNVDFVKRFWHLAEMKIMELGRVVGRVPKCKMNKLLHLPPELITFQQETNSGTESSASEGGSAASTDGVFRLTPQHGAPIVVPPPLSADGKPQGVTVRHLVPKSASSEPSKAVIIHFHGGGFLAQTSQSHVSYLSHWANQLNVPVVSVDYMTAPEHPYPRAVNDCFYAYAWVLRNATSLGTTAEKVILAGDSAGGNFVFGVAFLAAQYQLQKPCLVLGAYPALKISLDLSPARCLSVMDPLLPIGTLRACLNAYRGGGSMPEYHPNTGGLSQLQSGIHQRHAAILNASPAYLSPLLASDEMLHSLPSVALLPSSFDPLLDDSIVMARRLHALGKDVTLRPFDGVSHGFLNFHAVSRLARQATDACIELMDAAIKQHDQDV